jgi:hypothetical protein
MSTHFKETECFYVRSLFGRREENGRIYTTCLNAEVHGDAEGGAHNIENLTIIPLILRAHCTNRTISMCIQKRRKYIIISNVNHMLYLMCIKSKQT